MKISPWKSRTHLSAGGLLTAAMIVVIGVTFIGERGAQAGSVAHAPSAMARHVPRSVPAQSVSDLQVQMVEQQLLGTVQQLTDSGLPSGKKVSLLRQLRQISTQLRSAESLSRRINSLGIALDVALQSKLDTMAAIGRIGADLQINLDSLEANVNAEINANVDASVGGVDLSVKAQAAQVKADLSAKTDQLLVDITANLNVIQILALNTHAHIDAEKFSATLNALVNQLTLDLTAIVRDLSVTAKADVQAALQAEAKIRVDLTTQLKGLRTKVLGSISTRISKQQATITADTRSLNSTLSSLTARLTGIENQL